MSEIERQTPYKFAFDGKVVDLSAKVSFDALTLALDEVLTRMTKQQNAGYIIHKDHIAIFPKEKSEPAVSALDQYLLDMPKLGYTLEDRPDSVTESNNNTTSRAENSEVSVILSEPAYGLIVEEKAEGDDLSIRETKRPYYSANIIDPDSYFEKELPRWAVKIDLLYGLSTLTPNLSGEIGLGRRTTLELSGSNNRWNREGDQNDNEKFVHWTIRPEFRYWLCERFNGHFFGVNLTYWQYNISNHNLLWMFDKKYRYEGRAWGGGITYGYHYMLGKKWGVELEAGLGVAVMNHDKFECRYCGDQVKNERKVYFGPTRASVSIVYLFK